MAKPDQQAESPVPAEPDDQQSKDEQLSTAVVALTEDDVELNDRRRLLSRIVHLEIRDRGVRDLFKPRKAGQWIADAVTDVAPHIPVRDLETLRRHHDGLEGDALAERLIRNASLVTTAIGAAVGGVACVEWAVTPSLLTAPILLAAETVAVVAVEIKLVGELHEVYGRPIPGAGLQRGFSLIQAWSQRRGVNPLTVTGSIAVLGSTARKELRERVLRRFGRNLTALGPFLTGAAIAGYLNRRATLALGEEIMKDLKNQHRVIEG